MTSYTIADDFSPNFNSRVIFKTASVASHFDVIITEQPLFAVP
jgi:hypothetical protein